MSYRTSLDADELQLIQAAVVGCVRRIQEAETGAREHHAIRFTTAAAECLTRLNEGRIDHTDVMFINTCLHKTTQYLERDPCLPLPQKHAVRVHANRIINKLEGTGIPRVVTPQE